MDCEKRIEQLGIGRRQYNIPELLPNDYHLLTKVTPEWFVCHTTVHIGVLKFTSGAKAIVSVFVSPAGFTPSSWLTMLTVGNWDAGAGYLMDRMKVGAEGTHESIPCSTKDAYQLGPDDRIYVVNHGPLAITDVTITLVLPTYREILSDATSLSGLQRQTPEVVSYRWANENAKKRLEKADIELERYIENASGKQITMLVDFCDEHNFDEWK